LSTYFTGDAWEERGVRDPTDEAPGTLDLVRVFENTLNLENGPDELDSVSDAASWCREHGLPGISNPKELERLRAFREALRDVLFANNGEGDRRAAWEGLRPFASSASVGFSIDADCGMELKPTGLEGDGAIAELLAVVYDALRGGTWLRLRACRKGSCRFAYYDHTKNGSRAWCSMATCGNQAKAQRRRQRERHHQHLSPRA
jgi:predicted RNA-binding Zn ribbon-like protein